MLVYFALWTITGRYWGLQHDAQLYAVQALAKLQPDVFSGDLFLRFSSQDDFTLFPHLCAWVIDSLGLDRAAALLTLLFFAAWMLLSWLLARTLFGSRMAWLATGLLLVIPGWYGAGHVFRTAEPFLSARPAAEVACLGALLAFVQGRRLAAAALVVLAAAVHPIIAFPAALALVGLSMQRQDRRLFWPASAVLCFAGAIAGAVLVGGDSALMTGEWLLATKSRSDYLFLQTWDPPDWQTNLLPLVTVLFATQVLTGWPKRLAEAAFWVAICGLALAALASTVLPLKLLLQGQPWRWLWLASVLAIMFLPATLSAAWKDSTAGRVVALLVASAWLLAEWSSTDQLPPVGVAGILLTFALVVWWSRGRLREAQLALMLKGATGGVGLTLLGLAMTVAAVLKGQFDFGGDPAWVQRIADTLEFVAVPACIVTAAWWVTVRSRRPVGGTIAGLAATALVVGAAPGAAATWLTESFSASERDAFSDWRSRIPPQAEVFWPDGLPETWFLLERRSYLTISQLGGIVFSDALAAEAHRRARLLSPLVPAGHWFLDPAAEGRKATLLTAGVLSDICVDGGPDFVVDDDGDLGLEAAVIEWPTRAKFQYLYDCRDLRRRAFATRP